MKVKYEIAMDKSDPRVVAAFVAATNVKVIKHLISGGGSTREDITDQTGRKCGYWEVSK
jgi:hypothetical protein